MNPSTLYLYTLCTFACLAKNCFSLQVYSDVEHVSDIESDFDDERYAKALNRDPDDPNLTDKEIGNFNKNLDKTVAKVSRIYDKELGKLKAEMKAQNKEYLPIHGERLYRKISHSVFRDYDNFSTLKDGSFFGNMFAAPAGYEQEEI